MEQLLDRMRETVLRHAEGSRVQTSVPNLSLGVVRQPTVPMLAFYEPMVCLVLQGTKQVMVGGSLLRYDAANCFASTVELPATGCVLEASDDRPYLAVGLALDRILLAGLISEVLPIPATSQRSGYGLATVSIELLEAFDRLLALLDAPGDIAALGAGREREVLYRLLQGEHGVILRQAVREEGRLSQVRRAIDWMRRHLDQPLRTEALADIAGMSVPSFHRHFKAATSLSPLQYQKILRLHAARRLLITDTSTTQAPYSVGYESPSQFSREYSRLFGLSPSQDAVRLHGKDAAGNIAENII